MKEALAVLAFFAAMVMLWAAVLYVRYRPPRRPGPVDVPPPKKPWREKPR